MLWLSESDVEALVDPPSLVDAIDAAFAAFAHGALDNPPQTRIDDHGRGANYVAFPAYWAERNLFCVKVLAGVDANRGRGLPFLQSTNVLVDAGNGVPLALVSSAALTGWRTAATSAVALRRLAGPGRRTLGILGTGLQGRTHLHTLTAMHAFEEVIVCSPSGAADRAAALIAAAPRRFAAEATTSVDRVVDRADVLVTATSSAEPLFSPDRVRYGTLVLTAGKFRPGATEVPAGLCARAAMLVVDMPERFRGHWSHDTGPRLAQRELDRVMGLGEICAGTIPSPSADGIVLFFSEGMAMQDAVATRLVYDAALRAGAGLVLPSSTIG